ncbi:protein PIN-LIKES 3-like [Lotus japonicus]|uniref:protein PIN-LIKES 3-like n=1 Tax=Lotus japonicus TaxID=34305 RepID=UPI002586AB73|nr:protein PIN-LIKES 3-like [Lotus japonicus]XP_057425313.1 protein PIN-LIKES 3-like [Lotus japonicus]
MDFWELFVTALMPILKVLLVTAVGAFLALDRFEVLGEKERRHLNTIVYFVFSPALVCSNLAKSITFKSMLSLWFMPLNILLTFVIGTALGWLLVKITRAPHDMQGLVLGCCSAGNLGSLVFIIVLAVCKERNSPFGAGDVCYKNGLAYASLSMAIGAIFLWSYVYNIVRVYSCSYDVVEVNNNCTVGYPVSQPEMKPENPSKCSQGTLVTAVGSSKTNANVNQLEIECTVPEGEAKSFTGENWAEKIMKRIKASSEKVQLKAFLAPSTIGSVVGLIIGTVPELRRALIGDNAPLRVVQDSASMLGDAAIPSITLIVGANLLNGLKKSSMPLRLIVGILVVRYVALPMLGVVIVKASVHFGFVHHDPLYQFVLLLQFALPPAINIGTITQLFGVGKSECSVILLATYGCASVSLTLWCSFFMWLVL